MATVYVRNSVEKSASVRRGLALLETAIVILVVLWIVFGVLEYGWMLMKAQEINGAVRHGARTGAVLDASHQDVVDAVSAAMANVGLGDGNLYTLATEPVNLDDLEPGGEFEVTVRLRYNEKGGVALRLPVPRPAALYARVSMVKEGI